MRGRAVILSIVGVSPVLFACAGGGGLSVAAPLGPNDLAAFDELHLPEQVVVDGENTTRTIDLEDNAVTIGGVACARWLTLRADSWSCTRADGSWEAGPFPYGQNPVDAH